MQMRLILLNFCSQKLQPSPSNLLLSAKLASFKKKIILQGFLGFTGLQENWLNGGIKTASTAALM